MIKRFLAIGLLLCTAAAAHAQNTGSTYRTAIGIKGYAGADGTGGLNVKHFLSGNTALEGTLLFRKNFFALEGMYLFHGDINGARGLKWYVGPGAWIGAVGRGDNSDLYFAGKGTLGLDYKIPGAPISLAVDVNPQLRFTQNTDFDFYGGFAFRFAL